MPRSYEAILFDFDGVLVDSEPVHFECWNQVLAPYGLGVIWEDYVRDCVGISDKEMIRRLCRLTGRDDLFDYVWTDYPRKKQIFRDRILGDLPMPLSTRELLPSLGDWRLAVVSSSGRLEIEPALEAAGVRRHFSALVTAEDVTQLKPSPEPYQKAAQLLGVKSALVVEDSAAGIASGRAAGFDVLEIRSAHEMAGLLRAHLAEKA